VCARESGEERNTSGQEEEEEGKRKLNFPSPLYG